MNTYCPGTDCHSSLITPRRNPDNKTSKTDQSKIANKNDKSQKEITKTTGVHEIRHNETTPQQNTDVKLEMQSILIDNNA